MSWAGDCWRAGDVAQVAIPGTNGQLKFVVYVDVAAKFVVSDFIAMYPATQSYSESAEQLVTSFALRWLAEKPKPVWFVGDSSKSFDSRVFTEMLEDCGVGFHLSPGQAPWAHGIAE